LGAVEVAAFGLAWVALGLVVELFDPVVPVGGLVVVFVVAGVLLFAAGFFSSWQAASASIPRSGRIRIGRMDRFPSCSVW
jgi:hypothetical protein